MRPLLRFAAAAFAGLGVPGPALALGLDLLVAGGSLTSNDGELTFDDFSAVATGSVGNDLSLYDVSALDDGFALTGPIAAADGAAGDLFVAFRVTARQPIREVKLSFNGAASGTGSSASVVETAEGVADDEAFVFATGDGGLQLIDSLAIAGPSTTLRLAKDILVDSKGSGGIAVISRVEQRFDVVVPEAGALSLLSALLTGLALRRSRTI